MPHTDLFQGVVIASAQKVNQLVWCICGIKFHLKVVELKAKVRIPQEESVQINVQQAWLTLELWYNAFDLKTCSTKVS